MRAVIGITKLVALCCLAILPASAQTIEQQEPQAMSVCDVMGRLWALSEKPIAVRGNYDFGREYVAVSDRNCAVVFETQGHKWPNAIHLRMSTRPTRSETPIGRVDSRMEDFLYGAINLIRELYPGADHPFTVSATFLGVLHTRTPDYFATHGPAGFGHMNFYPAEIEVLGIKDVVISSLPAEPIRQR
jgi:hypothetical protein